MKHIAFYLLLLCGMFLHTFSQTNINRDIDRNGIELIAQTMNSDTLSNLQSGTTIYSADSSHLPNEYKGSRKLGLALGMPLYLSVVYGYNTEKFGFHISGMFLGPEVFGLQVGPSINIFRNKDTELNFVLPFSFWGIVDNDTPMSLNFMLELYLYGLHLQTGIGFVEEKGFTDYRPMVQLGYVIRLGK